MFYNKSNAKAGYPAMPAPSPNASAETFPRVKDKKSVPQISMPALRLYEEVSYSMEIAGRACRKPE